MTTKDILREKVGVCREYVKIFSEFCELAGFRVKGIRGYAKGPNFIPGMTFTSNRNLVFSNKNRHYE